jgi:hypothetical protein
VRGGAWAGGGAQRTGRRGQAVAGRFALLPVAAGAGTAVCAGDMAARAGRVWTLLPAVPNRCAATTVAGAKPGRLADAVVRLPRWCDVLMAETARWFPVAVGGLMMFPPLLWRLAGTGRVA